jgi:hypothetical protein
MSRRTALAWLIAAASAGCSRAAFFAANVPAAFGAVQRTRYRLRPIRSIGWMCTCRQPRRQRRGRGGLLARRALELRRQSDYRFVGAALASWVRGGAAELSALPAGQNAGLHGRCGAGRALGAAHAADYGADPKTAVPDGTFGGRASGRAGDARSALFCAPVRSRAAIAGVIGLSGPYDFLPLLEPDVKTCSVRRRSIPDSQPINFVRADAPPMLLVHGLKDDTVWPKNSRNLAARCRRFGVPVTLKLYPKLTHADTVAALSLRRSAAGRRRRRYRGHRRVHRDPRG